MGICDSAWDGTEAKFFKDGVALTYAGTDPDLDANDAFLIPPEWGDVQFVMSQQR